MHKTEKKNYWHMAGSYQPQHFFAAGCAFADFAITVIFYPVIKTLWNFLCILFGRWSTQKSNLSANIFIKLLLQDEKWQRLQKSAKTHPAPKKCWDWEEPGENTDIGAIWAGPSQTAIFMLFYIYNIQVCKRSDMKKHF